MIGPVVLFTVLRRQGFSLTYRIASSWRESPVDSSLLAYRRSLFISIAIEANILFFDNSKNPIIMLVKTATPIPDLIRQKLSDRLGCNLKGDIIDHGVIRYRLPSQEILIYAMQAISEILHKNYLSDNESYAFTFRFNNEDNCYHLFVEETLDSE